MINEEYLKQLEISSKTEAEAVKRLADIINVLRSENGCPWDKVQTHESLKNCFVEETYEVIEAIDNKDYDNLEEELGDVLLQVVFHAEIGQDSQKFNLCSIANRESDKMIRRHPHIFLNKTAKTIDKAVEKWDNVKRKEKGNESYSEGMRKIPKELPALMKSFKIQQKAANVGFDWEYVEEAIKKVHEETSEMLEAIENGQFDKIEEEIGDLLFSVVNVSRFLNVNPEQALNATSKKFVHRFAYIEDHAAMQGKKLEDMTLEEMDKLWEEAKL